MYTAVELWAPVGASSDFVPVLLSVMMRLFEHHCTVHLAYVIGDQGCSSVIRALWWRLKRMKVFEVEK